MDNPCSSGRPLILFADPDATTRAVFSRALRDSGFDVEEVGDGQVALDRAIAQSPDLVVLEVDLPTVDGLAACRAVRAQPALQAVPVLVLTGEAEAEAAERAFEAGATDFVTKAIAPAMLGHRIRFLLRATNTVEHLRLRESRLAEAQRIAEVGNWEWDVRANVFVGSAEALRLLESEPGTLITLDDVRARIHPQEQDLFASFVRSLADGVDPIDREFRVPRADGGFRYVRLRAHPFRSTGSVLRVLGTVQDVTDRVQQEERIRTLAYYDALTGLPNRILFVDQLRSAISGARRRGRKVAVMVLDLDTFKAINDTLGHDAGDAVLRQVSARLRDVVRGYDTLGRETNATASNAVGRMGGDEFMLAIADLGSGEEAAVVAGRLLAAFQQPVQVGTGQLSVSASIGIAVYPEDGDDMEALLKNADIALYQAKNAGRNTFEFFSDSMNASAFHRVVLETSLRRAIEQGEIAVHLQPQVDARRGTVVGAEALLRWTDARLGPVPPAHFVPLAERVGLIGPLTELAMRRVCEHLGGWAQAPAGAALSFNLSSHWFRRPDAIERLVTIPRSLGVAPGRFVLEVSESALVDYPREALRVMSGLKREGFRLAIDNFGTGYSSLATLRGYPVDYLKIDKTFIRGLGTEPAAESVCAAVIALARSLGVEPVAEGVEDEVQRDVLLRHGCGLMQGYLFGKPVPAEEFRFGPGHRVTPAPMPATG